MSDLMEWGDGDPLDGLSQSALKSEAHWWHGRALEMEAKNAKLRKLVRHLRECTRHNVCAACEYADDTCDFDYDMRELGMEED